MNKMSRGPQDCQSEVRVVFEKLSSLREESHRQFSDIIDSHGSSISQGIEELVKEVSDQQTELSVIRRERNGLLGTIDTLNGEIRQLRAELLIAHPLPAPDENYVLNMQGEDDFVVDVSHTLEQERPINHYEIGGKEVGIDCVELSNQNAQQNKQSVDDQKSFNDSTADEKGNKVVNEDIDADTPHVNKVFKCELCAYEFAKRSTLTYHKSSVHKIDESKFKYVCEQCPYETISKGHFKTHIEGMHERVRKYICDVCGYAAFRSGNLKQHKQRVHESAKNVANNKYHCEQCSYSSAQRSTLNAHIRGVHEKVKKMLVVSVAFPPQEKLL